MNRDELKARIEKIRGFGNVFDFNETQAKKAIIEPICECLKWETSDPDEVRLEYSTSSGGRVDYAFFNDKKTVILLEAKRPGESLDNSKYNTQLLGYAFEVGAPLAVLTNGIEWWLYLPREDGHWEERKFYTIDILAQEIDSICDRLIEFLGKDHVISGSAVDNAKKMRKSREGKQKIQTTLPEVWEEIINEPNELLVDLLIEETERKCGFKPNEQQAKSFINKITRPTGPLPARTTRQSSSGRTTKRPRGPKGNHLLPDYVIPVIRLIKNNMSHTDAFKLRAKELSVATSTVSSQCTRSLNLSTNEFIELLESNKIKSFLKRRFPEKASYLEQEL